MVLLWSIEKKGWYEMAKKSSKKIEKKEKKKCFELLYMSKKEIDTRYIYDIVKEMKGIQFDYWEAVDVLEIEFSEKSSIDIEPMNYDLKHPSDIAFIKNGEIQSIFAVTTYEDILEETKEIFTKVISQTGGFLCSDSEDFKPFYVE